MTHPAPLRRPSSRRTSNVTAAALALLAASLTCGAAAAPDRWLEGARDDAQRFERLERYLGGFSRSMWEVGERYARVHEALHAGNHALAHYHWEKIRATIQNGYLKRPGRQPNADALFLDEVWPAVDGAFASGDATRAWEGFEAARNACMSCHVAEAVPFMNDQPLFQTLRSPDRG